MSKGKFGRYGGQYVPEVLMPAINELEKAYEDYLNDDDFTGELNEKLRDYGGRPTPLYYAPQLSERVGSKVYLKREDLLHGGAHKLNNALGQVLLAKKMGKERIIAETGAGQHGTATAMASAALDMECEIYMGTKDIERQKPNVFRMRLMGAQVNPVETGTGTLKDAINETLRDWATNVENTHYVIGSIVGPHPFPAMVRDFQSVIGREIREQSLRKEERLPDSVVACAGGGSNTIGAFYEFLDDGVDLYAVEAGGSSLTVNDDKAPNSASLGIGDEGVLHGARTKILQDDDGQILESHSLSAGLDYSGVGPELAYLVDKGRVEARTADDDEALDAFHLLSETEGIIPALESSHAVALLDKEDVGDFVVVNLSGRGDKDLETVMERSDLMEDL
ncbi:MAG: tryptophan synthase subunit beta [Halobacteria archaeon]|nr:tryptophan synthase subunit beta [Halobacteria archaeon]